LVIMGNDILNLVEQGQKCASPDIKLTKALANTLGDVYKAWLAQRERINELTGEGLEIPTTIKRMPTEKLHEAIGLPSLKGQKKRKKKPANGKSTD